MREGSLEGLKYSENSDFHFSNNRPETRVSISFFVLNFRISGTMFQGWLTRVCICPYLSSLIYISIYLYIDIQGRTRAGR